MPYCSNVGILQCLQSFSVSSKNVFAVSLSSFDILQSIFLANCTNLSIAPSKAKFRHSLKSIALDIPCGTENNTDFKPTIRTKENSVIEIRGKGFMNEAGTRIVKTFMDKKLAAESNIMIGEDIHYPGKWSGFPSHSHNQPEIYFYKFYPENGFGLLKLGDEGILMEYNDTVKIMPNKVHPKVTAPGYAMHYVWIIRHLEGNPYIRPNFEEQHLWVEQPGAKYWPEI